MSGRRPQRGRGGSNNNNNANEGSSLSERFGKIAASSGRAGRRENTTAVSGRARFSNVMERRTGNSNDNASNRPARGRGGFNAPRGGNRGGSRGGNRGGNRGGRGGNRGGRGGRGGRGRGRGGKEKVTAEQLDKELEAYQSKNADYQKDKLDEELDDYFKTRDEGNTNGNTENAEMSVA